MIEDKKIGLKIATKKEALWIKVRDVRKVRIEDLEESLIVEKAVLLLAEDKIALENATNPRKK